MSWYSTRTGAASATSRATIPDASSSFRRIESRRSEIWGIAWERAEKRIEPLSSAACTLAAYSSLKAKGKKINVAYVFDSARGIKLFADQAYYAVGSDKTAIAPFPLKKDAEDYATKNGGRVLSFDDALKVALSGG